MTVAILVDVECFYFIGALSMAGACRCYALNNNVLRSGCYSLGVLFWLVCAPGKGTSAL